MFTKLIKKFGWALGCIFAIAVFVAVAGVSWIATCGLVYLVTLCFSLEFNWGVATGIWLVMFLLRSVFSNNADLEMDCVTCWDREIPEETQEEAVARVVEAFDDAMGRPASTIKDSGDRTQFETGACRDMHTGKGDMVSLPAAAILRLSKHYENGALKYGRWNYQKGIPVSSFIDSAFRHLFKYLDGWDDEDHLSAAAFNVLGAMEMEAHRPELVDLPTRKDKNSFEYPRE